MNSGFARAFVARLGREESGQTLVLVAIMLPVLIGFLTIAVEVRQAFNFRQRLQAAADNAALAGAQAVSANGTITAADLVRIVMADASAQGFLNGQDGTAIRVCRPAADASCATAYAYTPGDAAVKVTIRRVSRGFFDRILGITPAAIEATAVAGRSTGPRPRGGSTVVARSGGSPQSRTGIALAE